MSPFIAELRAMRDSVRQTLSDAERIATPSPTPASPSRDALQALPLCRAGAGDLSHQRAQAQSQGVTA
jgi:hypothetical protein